MTYEIDSGMPKHQENECIKLEVLIKDSDSPMGYSLNPILLKNIERVVLESNTYSPDRLKILSRNILVTIAIHSYILWRKAVTLWELETAIPVILTYLTIQYATTPVDYEEILMAILGDDLKIINSQRR